MVPFPTRYIHWKSKNVVLGIRTWGCSVTGTNRSAELWRLPQISCWNLVPFELFDFSNWIGCVFCKACLLHHRQLVVSIPSTIRPSTGQNQCYRNIILYETSVISIMVSHFDYKHRCLIEKNIPIVLILPSRWQHGAESLLIESNSCL